MRKILKKMKDEKGSITSVVLVTVLFFIIILSTALMISGTQRKSQLDSEITLKQVYQNQVDDAEKISKSLVVVKAPIPDGYYYVGGTDESGVVISDNIADKDRYSGEENVGKDLEGKGFDPRKLLAPGAEAIKDMVITKIKLFGSEGKADE